MADAAGDELALQQKFRNARVTLVSKDINLRIKAAVLGVHAEDYYSDKTLEDTDVLYSGMTALPVDFWEQHSKDMRSWKEGDRTFYEAHLHHLLATKRKRNTAAEEKLSQ